MSEEGVSELLNMLDATGVLPPETSPQTLAVDIEAALTEDWKTTDDIAGEAECSRSSAAVVLGRLVSADVVESTSMQGEIMWRGQTVRRNRIFFRLKSASKMAS